MVVATMIFITVFVAFLGVFSHHYKSVAKARTQLLAQHLARAKMADYVAAKYDGIDLILPAGQTFIETIPVSLTIRDQTVTIEFSVWAERTVTTTGLGGEKNIGVLVGWQEGDHQRWVTYRTFLSRYG